MDRPNISRGLLIEILLVDQPWSPVMLEQVSREDDSEIWQHVLSDLAEVQADRLLDPAWSGPLLDRPTVLEKMVELGMIMGAFQIPGFPMCITMPIATCIADVQLAMSNIDLTETCAGRWGRLRAILTASQMFDMLPSRFLTQYDRAQDFILRIGSSPEEFRTHQTWRVDAKHPDIVSRRVQALNDVLQKELVTQSRRIHLYISFPMGEEYWAMRAWWLQAVEEQIQRVWPGQQAQATTTQVSIDDA